jgi:hypothetical protein
MPVGFAFAASFGHPQMIRALANFMLKVVLRHSQPPDWDESDLNDERES